MGAGNQSKVPGFLAATPGDFVSPHDAIVLGWSKYGVEVNNEIIKVALNGIDKARLHDSESGHCAFPCAMGPAPRPLSGRRADLRRAAVVFEPLRSRLPR